MPSRGLSNAGSSHGGLYRKMECVSDALLGHQEQHSFCLHAAGLLKPRAIPRTESSPAVKKTPQINKDMDPHNNHQRENPLTHNSHTTLDPFMPLKLTQRFQVTECLMKALAF